MQYVEEDSVDYKKQREAIQGALKSAIKKSPTKLLKREARKMENNEKTKKLCELSRALFHEGIMAFEREEMTFEDFVDDLQRSLVAIYESVK